MHGQILQRQLKRGSGILQVVHEKSRDGLKRFQLLAQHDFFSQSKV